MPFTVPNAADAAFSDQARLMSGDLQILGDASFATGVVSGCAVTAQGSPDMTLAVAVGMVAVVGIPAAVTAGNVTITAADSTSPRIDLVVVSSTGTKSVTAGTPAGAPVIPTIPASSVVLAAVYVPAADTAINANQIIDKRTNISVTSQRYVAGRYYLLAPGVWHRDVNTGFETQILFAPFIAPPSGFRIDRLAIQVTSAGEAGALLRLGIYTNATSGYDSPGALVVDGGTVAASTTGQKEVSFTAVTIPPGINWTATIPESCPTTRPQVVDCSDSLINNIFSSPTIGDLGVWNGYYQNGVSAGSLPASATVGGVIGRVPILRARAA